MKVLQIDFFSSFKYISIFNKITSLTKQIHIHIYFSFSLKQIYNASLNQIKIQKNQNSHTKNYDEKVDRCMYPPAGYITICEINANETRRKKICAIYLPTGVGEWVAGFVCTRAHSVSIYISNRRPMVLVDKPERMRGIISKL